MHPSLVSVIIPAYNSEKVIRPCLDSVLAQTLHDIEIILVDDGSTDSTPAILDEYAAKDARINVIHQPNGGAGAARNRGLCCASGLYLSFLDADDIFEPDMLRLSYEKAREAQADIVVFESDKYYENTGSFVENPYAINKKLLPAEEPFSAYEVSQDIFKLFIGWPWDKLFRADFIRNTNLEFQQQRTSNDLFFVFCAILKAERIITMKDLFVHHRIASSSLSVTREKSWYCFHDALILIRQQLTDWFIFARFEQDFINYALHFSLWHLNTLAEPAHTLLEQKLKTEWFREFGITAHQPQYFYNQKDYLQYIKISDGTQAEITEAPKQYCLDNCDMVRQNAAAKPSHVNTAPSPANAAKKSSLLKKSVLHLKKYGLKKTVKRVLQKVSH